MNKFLVSGVISQSFEQKTEKFGIMNVVFDTYNSQKKENEPTFVSISIFGSEKQMEYLKSSAIKGNRAVIHGTFASNNYTDKNGNNISTYRFSAASSDVEIIKKNNSSVSQQTHSQEVVPKDIHEEISLDDLDF